MFAFWEVVDMGDGPRLTIKMQSGREQYVQLKVDGRIQGTPKYVDSTNKTQFLGIWESPDTEHLVEAVPQGDFSSARDWLAQTIKFQADKFNRLNATITANPDFLTYGASGQFANWSITGLKRFQNCSPQAYVSNWGKLQLTMSTDGGVHTVTLKAGSMTVMEGSRTGDGEVTLAEQNSSGASGTVDLTYSGDIASGAELIARWPIRYEIHYQEGSAWTAPDFPRTPSDDTVYDDGYSNDFPYVSAALAAGTWHVVVHSVDENENETTGIAGGGDQVVIVTVPDEPTALAYSSGDAAATVISWTSPDAGYTYNIYESGETGILDLITASTTHAGGSGTLTKTLAAITATWTGVRQVLVRSVVGGVEDGNGEVIEIEYVNGVVVSARPPAPALAENITLSGRTITIPATVNVIDAGGTPDVVLLYLFDPTGSPNYNQPVDAVELEKVSGALVKVSGIVSTQSGGTALSVSATHTGDARRKFAARCATAVGAFTEIEGDASSQLSNITVTGADLTNTNGGILYWELTDTGGTRKVIWYSDAAKATKVAEGTNVGDGTITMVAQGGSGLTGSVDVTYSGDDTDAANVMRCNVQSNNTDTYGPVELTDTPTPEPTQAVSGGF